MPIEQRLSAFITKALVTKDAVDLDPAESLLESGVLDSMGVIEVVSFIEKEFGVAVEDEEIVPENFESIRALARFVMSKMAGQDEAT